MIGEPVYDVGLVKAVKTEQVIDARVRFVRPTDEASMTFPDSDSGDVQDAETDLPANLNFMASGVWWCAQDNQSVTVVFA